MDDRRQGELFVGERPRSSSRYVVAFTSVRAPNGWLGNMSPHPLTVETSGSLSLTSLVGEWRTAEALFQATRFGDAIVREEIRACRSPMQCKMIAKRNAYRRVVELHGEQDLVHMELILMLKLAQHPDLKERLRAFPSDAFIVEDVTARGVSKSAVFWGAALIKSEWIGENRLGRLWMEIRQRLTT